MNFVTNHGIQKLCVTILKYSYEYKVVFFFLLTSSTKLHIDNLDAVIVYLKSVGLFWSVCFPGPEPVSKKGSIANKWLIRKILRTGFTVVVIIVGTSEIAIRSF